MKKFLALAFLGLFFSINILKAQSCFNVSAGNDTTISCTQPCLDLKARIPDLRTSETYQVVSIPYAPYAYTTPFGTTDPLVNADDHFSDSFPLPFPFCFYGNTYTKIAVGSNGVITFDVTANANTGEAYFIEPGNIIPYALGFPDNPDIYYAPRASIFLAYVDLNPLTSPSGNKIEWRVEGIAPCRRFVVSYYRQGNWAIGLCPNSTNLTTMQAVLYEGSGIIDVFYESKPSCTAYQGGLAIAGVQNWNQDQAVTPPGWNGTVWQATNQGIRYVPSGTGSLLNRVELYKNGTLVPATVTTTPLGNGELDVLFSGVCQSEDSMSYVVKAFYKQCDNPAIETEGSDTIIVYKRLTVTAQLTNPPCNGNLGTISILSPNAPPFFEYSIDGGVNWQTFWVFNVPAGTYTIMARPIGSPCIGFTTVTITQPTVYTPVVTVTDATCLNSRGSITIASSGGTPPYEYTITGGAAWQSSNVFNNLPPGFYSVWSRDANQCNVVQPGPVALIDTMRLELGPDSTICFGSSLTLLPQTNAATDTFKWTPAAGLDYDTAKNPVASPNDTTKYYLLAKWGACQRTDSITINVLHKPVAHAGNDTTICYKTNATLNGWATDLSGSVNYAWTPPDSLNTPNAASSIVRMDTSRQFTLTVTDNYGCNFSVSDSMWIFMQPVVPAFAGNDTNAMANKPHQLYGTGAGTGGTYLWSPTGPLDNPFIKDPKAVLSNDTYFTLLVTDAIGCTAEDGVFIKVYDGPEYYIPNAFTPNGDGLNDIFRPIPAGMTTPEYFRVFNRGGQLVFQTNKWLEGWDGKFKGRDASQGTYVWMIKGRDVNGRVVEMQGTVILLR